MLQLRQLNLQFAFPRAGALRENIQNKRSAIEDLAIEYSLEIAALRGRKLVVENHRIDICLSAIAGELVRLSFPDKCARAGGSQLLQSITNDLASSSRRQLSQLLH